MKKYQLDLTIDEGKRKKAADLLDAKEGVEIVTFNRASGDCIIEFESKNGDEAFQDILDEIGANIKNLKVKKD